MKNQYSLSELIKIAYSLTITKITFGRARLIRRPVYIRGRKSITGCERLTTGRFCRFDLDGVKHTLHIGANCEMGDMTHIVAMEKVEIGENVLIASKCFISDASHGEYVKKGKQSSPYISPNKRELVTQPIIIGNNVWIGENAVILAGTQLGNGCIVGANSVVKGVFPDNTIIAGVPAKIIKIWNEEKGEWEKT